MIVNKHESPDHIHLMSCSVRLHSAKYDDAKSRWCAAFGRVAFPYGHINKFSHVSLRLGQQVYELTWGGISVTDLKVFTRPVEMAVMFNMSPLALDLAAERIKALIRADVKLSVWDLLRFALRRKTNGLICTDFVEVVLGTERTNSTPAQLHTTLMRRLNGKTIWLDLSNMNAAPNAEAQTI